MFAKNTLWNAIYQLSAVVAGFLIPQTLIGCYGSEVNGLVASLTQFIGYFALVEAGISGAATFALYGPLAHKDWHAINVVVSASRVFYQKSGAVFLVLLIALSVLYPLGVSLDSLTGAEVCMLSFLLGFKVVVDFFLLSKYRVFLTADEKNWVIQLASTVFTLLNTGIVLVLAYMECSVVLVYAVALLAVFARSAILVVYTRRRYPELDSHIDSKGYTLPQRWDALFLQILGAIQLGAPVVLATVFTDDLAEVSVLAVYILVANGIQMIPSVFGFGLQASFGKLLAAGKFEELRRSYRAYRALVYCISASVCGCAFALIMPFIDLYAASFYDADYHNVLLGFLVVMNVVLYHGKSSQGLLVIAAGMYRETRIQTVVQAAIIIVAGIPLTMHFGVCGTLAAACLSNLYRVVDLLVFEPRRITHDSVTLSFRSFALYLVQVLLVAAPGMLLSPLVGSWLAWLVAAGVLVAWSIGVLLSTLYLFDRESYTALIRRVKG